MQTIYCINVLRFSSKLHLNVLNSLKIRNCVRTVLVRSMLKDCTKIVLARVDSVNGMLLHFDNFVKPDIKQPSTSASMSSENVTAVATLISKNYSAELQNLAHIFAYICFINVLSPFTRSLIKNPSLRSFPNRLLNAYAFRELIASSCS